MKRSPIEKFERESLAAWALHLKTISWQHHKGLELEENNISCWTEVTKIEIKEMLGVWAI